MVKSVGKETISDWGDGSTTPVTDPTERGGSGSWSRKSELIELEAVPGCVRSECMCPVGTHATGGF